MDITNNISQGNYNVTLVGRFDFDSHAGFHEIIKEIENKEVKCIILHMAGVNYIDSASLVMLLLALEEAKKHQKEIVISGAAGYVKKIFDLVMFDTLFVMT